MLIEIEDEYVLGERLESKSSDREGSELLLPHIRGDNTEGVGGGVKPPHLVL